MIPDRLQYFLDDFWKDQNFDKSGPSDQVSITKIFQQVQEIWGHLWKIFFHI